MFKSNFGVTGCLPWKERDNGVTTGGCTLETRFDSMGLVSIGGCQNSDTGGPGYVNISGGCCINDPPPECITKSTDKIDKIGKTDKIGNSKLNTGYSECDNYQSYGGGLTYVNKQIYYKEHMLHPLLFLINHYLTNLFNVHNNQFNQVNVHNNQFNQINVNVQK